MRPVAYDQNFAVYFFQCSRSHFMIEVLQHWAIGASDPGSNLGVAPWLLTKHPGKCNKAKFIR